jgi:hypothetical protein
MNDGNQRDGANPDEGHPLKNAKWAGLQEFHVLNVKRVGHHPRAGDSDKKKPDPRPKQNGHQLTLTPVTRHLQVCSLINKDPADEAGFPYNLKSTPRQTRQAR